MPPSQYPIRHKKRSPYSSPPKEKPCKRCYALMVMRDGVWVCKKHGPDTE